MTRLEIFKQICDLTSTLDTMACQVLPGPLRDDLTAVVDRLDHLIDRCIREGVQPLHAADRSPCPACGQACCTHWRVLQGAKPVEEAAP